jgi:hypothetical protein
LSKPDALRELDKALHQRDADFAILVVPTEEKVPAKLRQLREYNGDKLIVTFDPEADDTLGLELAYSLARARVLMSRSEAEDIDAAAIRDAVERALNSMEMVQGIKSQLTGAQNQIGRAKDVIDDMAGQVREHLRNVDRLVREESAEPPPKPAQETLV